jgi:hypothetical protein
MVEGPPRNTRPNYTGNKLARFELSIAPVIFSRPWLPSEGLPTLLGDGEYRLTDCYSLEHVRKDQYSDN